MFWALVNSRHLVSIWWWCCSYEVLKWSGRKVNIRICLNLVFSQLWTWVRTVSSSCNILPHFSCSASPSLVLKVVTSLSLKRSHLWLPPVLVRLLPFHTHMEMCTMHSNSHLQSVSNVGFQLLKALLYHVHHCTPTSHRSVQHLIKIQNLWIECTYDREGRGWVSLEPIWGPRLKQKMSCPLVSKMGQNTCLPSKWFVHWMTALGLRGLLLFIFQRNPSSLLNCCVFRLCLLGYNKALN